MAGDFNDRNIPPEGLQECGRVDGIGGTAHAALQAHEGDPEAGVSRSEPQGIPELVDAGKCRVLAVPQEPFDGHGQGLLVRGLGAEGQCVCLKLPKEVWNIAGVQHGPDQGHVAPGAPEALDEPGRVELAAGVPAVTGVRINLGHE